MYAQVRIALGIAPEPQPEPEPELERQPALRLAVGAAGELGCGVNLLTLFFLFSLYILFSYSI